MKTKKNFRRLFSVLIIIDSCTKLTAREHLIRDQFKCNHWVATPGTRSLIKKGSGASGTFTLTSGKTADENHITSIATDGATSILQRGDSSTFSARTTPDQKYSTFTFQNEATEKIVNEGGRSFGVSNSTTEGATTNNGDTITTETVGIHCFNISGSNTHMLENGSSTVDANCRSIITCINGEIRLLKDYNCGPNAACEVRNGVRECYCPDGFYSDGENCSHHMTNCLDIFNDGYLESGVYRVKPSNWNGSPFEVYCDMSEGGGWTVFQRRVNGSVEFNQTWDSYKEGFGDLEHEFWLGNDKLYYLTNQGIYSLGIDMVNEHGFSFYAQYDAFRINNESDNYRLSALGTYSGTAVMDDPHKARTDALMEHLNCPFTTIDRDNDDNADGNCAEIHRGAWWYKQCMFSNLNGDYHGFEMYTSCIHWAGLPGGRCSIKYTEMKIRPMV